ncbi:MAG: hypothetical protein ACK47B_04800 [Armatimonadota bacterium]
MNRLGALFNRRAGAGAEPAAPGEPSAEGSADLAAEIAEGFDFLYGELQKLAARVEELEQGRPAQAAEARSARELAASALERLERLEKQPRPQSAVSPAAASTPPPAPASALSAAWSGAPLALRIGFLSALLGAEHPLQGALHKAAGLLDLLQRPDDLRTWARQDPQALAEARATVQQGAGFAAGTDPETLAVEIVREAAGSVEAGLSRLDPGSGPAAAAPPPVTAATSSAVPEASDLGWLQVLEEQSRGESSWAVSTAMRALTQLTEAAGRGEPDEGSLRRQLTSLLPLLSADDGAPPAGVPESWLDGFLAVRPELLAWLRSALQVELGAPEPGTPFDPAVMEAVGERQPMNPADAGTVARAERVGAYRHGRVLVPTRVVRYVSTVE